MVGAVIGGAYISSIAISALCVNIGNDKTNIKFMKDNIVFKEMPTSYDEDMVFANIFTLSVPGVNLIYGLDMLKIGNDDERYNKYKQYCLDWGYAYEQKK